MSKKTKLKQAVKCYINRKNRTEHPDGAFDNKKRWLPYGETEHRDCCRYIRHPSAAHPFSLMVHCRTAEHISNLFGVEAKEIKRLARIEIKKESAKGAQNET